ncbi:MAG: hypothetical protein AB8G11_23140 [Saprospiraceae bacterium]
MKIIYLSIISLFVLAACNSPKLKYCENEYVFIHHEALKPITLDFEQNETDFEKQLLKNLEVDLICSSSKLAGLPLDLKTDDFHKSFGAVTLPVMFFNNCPKEENIPVRHKNLSKHFIFEINADAISFNGHMLLAEKDSILNALETHWFKQELTYNDFQKFDSRFYLSVDLPSNNKLIQIIISSYTQFYLKKLDEYTRKAFDEYLCDINVETFKLWKKDLNFMIHICYTDDCILLRQPSSIPK